MNKKGFTLIELLAVIIILGILMIIAIPSVTRYISDSRKNAYVDTAKEIISGARNLVNEGKLEMYDTNTAYYIPTSCIKTENASKSPYGEFIKDKTFVVVTYDGKGYDYYWLSVDDAGQGVKKITSINDLDTDDIESDLTIDDIEVGVIFDSREKYSLINNDCKTYQTEDAIFGGAAGTIYRTINNPTGTRSRLAKVVHDNGDVDYRYQGNSPDNFVSFNNQKWRIVGIFDGKLKIVRYYGYAVNPPSHKWGSSKWDLSDMKNYLNNDIYNSIDSNYKDMIDENITWYLVGPADPYLTKEQFYLEERNEANTSNNHSFTSTTTKIGLIYPSDFGYASYDEIEENENYYCPKDLLLSEYRTEKCFNNNWLAESSNYTISKRKTGGYIYMLINYKIDYVNSDNSYGAKPTLYLKKDVKIVGGDGTESKPYQLSY